MILQILISTKVWIMFQDRRRRGGDGARIAPLSVRVLRRLADATAGRRQQLARLRGGPAHVPAHEETSLLNYNVEFYLLKHIVQPLSYY